MHALGGLLDPFDPIQALPKSAEFLRELRSQFGNLGLGAAVADILFVMMFVLALAYLRVFQPTRAAERGAA